MDSNYKRRLLSPTKAKETPSTPTKKLSYSDRHIPSNTAKELQDSYNLLSTHSERKPGSFDHCYRNTYNQILQNELLGTQMQQEVQVTAPWSPQSKRSLNQAIPSSTTTADQSPSRLFSYAHKPSVIDDSLFSLSPMGMRSQAVLSSPKKIPRKIPKLPFRVLEAPNIQDDFYLNLVDWSSQNILAVGLNQSVFLWHASSGTVTKLCDFTGDSQVASVSWMGRGSHLAVGSTHGAINLWDISQQKQVRTFPGHKSRVGTLAWANSPRWLLSSGSRDKSISHHDVRSRNTVGKFVAHKQEVCGLEWGYNPTSLLASGGNDNNLLLWDYRMFGNSDSTNVQPVFHFSSHRAAVKAITWSPHQRGLLASGGGTADQCIKFWNAGTGKELNTIATGSQVCNLAWSKNVDEIVSTHGYSQNHISVWQYPTLNEVVSLTGHSMRVLYLAVSPDGQTIVTGAGDETLKFWSIFPKAPSSSGDQPFSPLQSLPEIR